MDLLMKKIHMCRQAKNIRTQMTLDEDFNVPDVRPDVDTIIQCQEKVTLEHTRAESGKLYLDGFMEVRILYMDDTKERALHRLDTKLPFDEAFPMENLVPGEVVRVHHETEDLSVSMINSRKLAIRALVSLEASVDEVYDLSAAVEVQAAGRVGNDDDRSRLVGGMENLSDQKDRGHSSVAGNVRADGKDRLPVLCEKKEKLEYLQLEVQNKDILRLKEDVPISPNKPDIREILWENVQLRSCRTHLEEGKIGVQGNLFLFVLYRAEDEKESLQWMEQTIPVDGEVACENCSPGLVPDIEVNLAETELTAKEDIDGELRILHLEGVLDLNLRLYGTDTAEILSDVFSPEKDLELVSEEESYETLVVRNESKCRAQGKIRIQSAKPPILQICHCSGSVKIDKTQQIKNGEAPSTERNAAHLEDTVDGILVEGAILVSILYVSSNDTMPLALLEGTVPFSHVAEAQGLDANCRYTLRASLDQISSTMTDSEEIEIRASIGLNLLAVRADSVRCIHEIHQKDFCLEKIEKVPGITGYIVQEGENLWDIAKAYYQTPQQIAEMNGLAKEEVQKGDRLILMKNVNPHGGAEDK